MKLSIIIPALNEEYHLPRLLKSIKRQTFSDYEIIIADAGSMDATKKIARASGCKVVRGGLPAKGRNEGVKGAKGELLLFLDADVVLPEQFLSKALAEFERRNLHIASFYLKPQQRDIPSVLFLDLLYNIPILLMEKILPHAAMAILVKKDLFLRLGGFDETIVLAEDHDLARRARKVGRYGLIRSISPLMSFRRFKKDGWLRTSAKYFASELHMIFRGPVRSKRFNYRFDHYENHNKPITHSK